VSRLENSFSLEQSGRGRLGTDMKCGKEGQNIKDTVPNRKSQISNLSYRPSSGARAG
jgi:hypothetical protein